jgi:hypothetical protein
MFEVTAGYNAVTMKSAAARNLILVLLVVAAFGLAVANKLRVDRHARNVAQTLNGKEPGNKTAFYEGPEVLSNSETGQASREESQQVAAPAGGTGTDPHRLDLVELKKAVLAGDASRVLDIRGNLEAEDAAIIHSLLYEVPSGLDDEESGKIKSFLVNLLQKTPGSDAPKLLFAVVMQEGLLSKHDWCVSVHVLGQRRFAPARTYLDNIAFGGGNGDVYSSTCALIGIDSNHYIQRTAQAIGSFEETKLWDYVSSLQQVASVHHSDIGPAVPSLKVRFLATSTRWECRTLIAKTLEVYSRHHKSIATREWLVEQLRGIIQLPSSQVPPACDMSIYRDMLQELQTSHGSDPQ